MFPFVFDTTIGSIMERYKSYMVRRKTLIFPCWKCQNNTYISFSGLCTSEQWLHFRYENFVLVGVSLDQPHFIPNKYIREWLRFRNEPVHTVIFYVCRFKAVIESLRNQKSIFGLLAIARFIWSRIETAFIRQLEAIKSSKILRTSSSFAKGLIGNAQHGSACQLAECIQALEWVNFLNARIKHCI